MCPDPKRELHSQSIEVFVEDQAFSPIWLLPSPVSKLDRRLKGKLRTC